MYVIYSSATLAPCAAMADTWMFASLIRCGSQPRFAPASVASCSFAALGRRDPSSGYRWLDRCAAAQVVYSQFRGLVDQGKVASARFDESSQRVYFELQPEYLRQVRTAAGDLAWPEGTLRYIDVIATWSRPLAVTMHLLSC